MTDLAPPPRLPDAPAAERDQFFHALHAAGLVGVWMALGWLLHLDPNSYLLLGVPLVILFQAFVRRQPLVTLWVRKADRFHLDFPGVALGLLLALWPARELVEMLRVHAWTRHLPEILWLMCSLAGAFAAAFSLRRFNRATWLALRFCLTTAGVAGGLLMLAGFLFRQHLHHASLTLTARQWENGLSSLLLYFPICFLMEEVAFRGALDAHVQRPGDKNSLLTAVYISALWGLWHLPICGAQGWLQIAVLVVALPAIHILTGVFLSLSWRRGGNLAVTALVHALIDAVRNMLA